MIKKLISLLILSLFACAAFADNEKEKQKNGDETEGVIVYDSISGDSIYQHVNENEDTLVYEDWDGANGTTNDNSSIETGGEENVNQEEVYSMNQLIGDLVENRKKRYDVSFTIYPNPTADELHINAENVPMQIRIINISGDILLQTENTSVIDVSSYESGMYFIELIYFDHIETRKFVKRV